MFRSISPIVCDLFIPDSVDDESAVVGDAAQEADDVSPSWTEDALFSKLVFSFDPPAAFLEIAGCEEFLEGLVEEFVVLVSLVYKDAVVDGDLFAGSCLLSV